MTSSDNSTESEPIIADLPLWKSFWIGQLGAVLCGALIMYLLGFSRRVAALNMSENVSEIVGWAIFAPLYVLFMLSLWKCAYNTNNAIWGHLARAYAVLTSLFFIAILIIVIFD